VQKRETCFRVKRASCGRKRKIDEAPKTKQQLSTQRGEPNGAGINQILKKGTMKKKRGTPFWAPSKGGHERTETSPTASDRVQNYWVRILKKGERKRLAKRCNQRPTKKKESKRRFAGGLQRKTIAYTGHERRGHQFVRGLEKRRRSHRSKSMTTYKNREG